MRMRRRALTLGIGLLPVGVLEVSGWAQTELMTASASLIVAVAALLVAVGALIVFLRLARLLERWEDRFKE